MEIRSIMLLYVCFLSVKKGKQTIDVNNKTKTP